MEENESRSSSDSSDSDDAGKPSEPPPQLQPQPGQGQQMVRRCSSFLGTEIANCLIDLPQANTSTFQIRGGLKGVASAPIFTQVSTPLLRRRSSSDSTQDPTSLLQRRRSSSMFMAPDVVVPAPDPSTEVNQNSNTAGFATRWGLMLLACALKMAAYWCQLKANERIYSSHLSAIRKSGVLLVLLLGNVLFHEEIGNKLMPVGTMLAGVAVLA